MAEYIERSIAVAIVGRADDEHPYAKDITRPETYSDYNQGWSAACDYIESQLEGIPAADVAPVRHGWWRWRGTDRWNDAFQSSNCGRMSMDDSKYCPICDAKMDGEETENG